MNNYQHISELENEVDYAADCEEIISHSHTVLFMEVILLQKVHCLPGSPHPAHITPSQSPPSLSPSVDHPLGLSLQT